MSDLQTLVGDGVLDAELAALVWTLAENGVPLVVASSDSAIAEGLRRAYANEIRTSQPARDAVAGGVVVGSSLEDVLRIMGGATEMSDETRDLGMVLVVRDGRVEVAHYVRPVERDGAGHLQRRPPAVLSSWNVAAGAPDNFWWAVTDELASRAGLTREELERAVDERARQLSGRGAAPGPQNARH